MDSVTNQRLGDHADEEFWGCIHATDERLRRIGRQNAALSERVEMLGRFVATSDALVEHLGEADEDR